MNVSLFLLDIQKAFFFLCGNLFLYKVTLLYPIERSAQTSRIRGEHVLRRYGTGKERCIVCRLCERICPAEAITIYALSSYIGNRYALDYLLDMTKCIYCGLCQEACPVDAIVESSNFEFAKYSHVELLYTKQYLLLLGDILESELVLAISTLFFYK